MKITLDLSQDNQVTFTTSTIVLHYYPNCGYPTEHIIYGSGDTLEESAKDLKDKTQELIDKLISSDSRSWFEFGEDL